MVPPKPHLLVEHLGERGDFLWVTELRRCGCLRNSTEDYDIIGARLHDLSHITGSRYRVTLHYASGMAPQSIKIDWCEQTYGWRPYLVCACGDRYMRLYQSNAGYLCRTCLGAIYEQSGRGDDTRRLLRAAKLRLRLNGNAGAHEKIPGRVKAMHRSTYRVIKSKLEEWRDQIPPEAKVDYPLLAYLDFYPAKWKALDDKTPIFKPRKPRR